jgi:L-lysine 6-transaminase
MSKEAAMRIADRLKEHILVDGFHVVADTKKSDRSWIVDAESGKRYLDCYSQFASQVLGWNHPYMDSWKYIMNSNDCSLHKLANSDMYSENYALFVEKFAEVTPDFCHYFFIDGGALGVENALKAAFDWKYQLSGREEMDIIHFDQAFHGRTGYTLSLTNNGGPDSENTKTKWFPKFNWTRVHNPKIPYPFDESQLQNSENHSIDQIETALRKGNVAAIIIEPIQGEGGDNHFRKGFFVKLRELADQYQAMLIFDEVQTGVGLTGKMWCYEHFGVVPDLMCFGKKTQVCGFCSTNRIDTVPNNVFHVSGRINSTWGGNIVDMVRSRIMLQAIQDLHLVERAQQVGDYFQKKLKTLSTDEVTNVRGRGLMLAIDLPSTERRDELVNKLHENMLVLKSGSKSIRFRPTLTFGEHDVDDAIEFLNKALS